MKTASLAVILSGCGFQDGAEIHEATLTLWSIHRHGADYHCFAPDIYQHDVINHLSGEPMDERRNVLIESARIARGEISAMGEFNPDHYDALILPGGFGAAKNLSDFALKGADCQVNVEVEKAILDMHSAGKPIGALCISPALLARLLPGTTLTIGQDAETAGALETMGASHSATQETEIVIDSARKVVTAPCYMLDSRVDKIGEGADRLVTAILEMIP